MKVAFKINLYKVRGAWKKYASRTNIKFYANDETDCFLQVAKMGIQSVYMFYMLDVGTPFGWETAHDGFGIARECNALYASIDFANGVDEQQEYDAYEYIDDNVSLDTKFFYLDNEDCINIEDLPKEDRIKPFNFFHRHLRTSDAADEIYRQRWQNRLYRANTVDIKAAFEKRFA